MSCIRATKLQVGIRPHRGMAPNDRAAKLVLCPMSSGAITTAASSLVFIPRIAGWRGPIVILATDAGPACWFSMCLCLASWKWSLAFPCGLTLVGAKNRMQDEDAETPAVSGSRAKRRNLPSERTA